MWVVGRSANKQQKPKSFSQQSSAPSEAAPPCFSPCVYAGSYLVICELLCEIVTPPTPPAPPLSPAPLVPGTSLSPEAPRRLDATASPARPRLLVVPPSPARFELQNLILRECFTTVVPNLLSASSAPASIWVTPPSREARFNRFFIENSLCYLLAPCPGRLRVRCVASGVFHVIVSCANVANVLVVRGALRIGSVELRLHPSLASAMLAVDRLPPLPPVLATNAGPRLPTCPKPCAVISVDPSSAPLPPPPATLDIRLGKVPQDLLTVPAISLSRSSAMPPVVVTASRLVPGSAAVSSMDMALNSLSSALPRSYLQAALTPAPSKPVEVITLSRPASLAGCFRCLASITRSRTVVTLSGAGSALPPATAVLSARCLSAASCALCRASCRPLCAPSLPLPPHASPLCHPPQLASFADSTSTIHHPTPFSFSLGLPWLCGRA